MVWGSGCVVRVRVRTTASQTGGQHMAYTQTTHVSAVDLCGCDRAHKVRAAKCVVVRSCAATACECECVCHACLRVR